MKTHTFLVLCGLLGLLLTGCGSSVSSPATSGNSACTAQHLTMGATTYCTTSLSIARGSTITFVDDPTGTTHILVIGANGQAAAENGAPDFGPSGHTFAPGQSWTTPTWNVAGTFHVTCVVHPTTMNLIITVTG